MNSDEIDDFLNTVDEVNDGSPLSPEEMVFASIEASHRRLALEGALQTSPSDPDRVLATARQFYEFLTGESDPPPITQTEGQMQ